MKISNIKAIKVRYSILIIVMTVFTISTLTAGLILDYIVFSLILCLTIFCLIYWVLIRNLKFFEFENSGYVITIKSYDLLNKPTFNMVEIPSKKLLDFEITSTRYGILLKFYISSKRDKKVYICYKITGLNDYKKSILHTSLTKTILNNTLINKEIR